MSAARPVVRVAAGVILGQDGAVLLADRPAGKAYEGYWEFPGGKIEPGESVEQALARELAEELHIGVAASTPWVVFEFDYPHAYVRLHFRRVFAWTGEPVPLEGQRVQFCDPRGDVPQPLLPAAIPVMRWLRLPALLDGRCAPQDGAGAGPPPRQVSIGGERWLAADVRDRDQLKRAATLGADFAIAAPMGEAQFAALCLDAPMPVYLRDPRGAAALARARGIGAHGIAT